MARHSSGSYAIERIEAQASSGHREATSPLVAQPLEAPTDMISQLVPILMALQQA